LPKNRVPVFETQTIALGNFRNVPASCFLSKTTTTTRRSHLPREEARSKERTSQIEERQRERSQKRSVDCRTEKRGEKVDDPASRACSSFVCIASPLPVTRFLLAQETRHAEALQSHRGSQTRYILRIAYFPNWDAARSSITRVLRRIVI
jgi:hypothetical protein